MRKIGIDCRLINETGVGVYIQNLLCYFPKNNPDVEWYFFANNKGSELIEKIVKNNKYKIVPANSRWHSFDEQTKFLLLINSFNLDLMHFPYFSYPILYSRPFVITIHDLIPLQFKTGMVTTLNPFVYNIKHLAYKLTLTTGVKRSKAILVPSNTIMKEIVRHFGSNYSSKIHVTYEGVNEKLINTKSDDSLKNKYKKPFLVRFGNFYPHKNIERLIAAYGQLCTDVDLILVGPRDFFATRMEELVSAVEKKDNIIFHFNASIAECVYFYKNALALVQPSISEGFGLPVIEAQYFNCPVIASKIPVFEELLGYNHSYLFVPTDINSIQSTLNSFLKNHKYRYNSGINKQILEKYSFRKMAEDTIKIYIYE